MNIFVIDNAVKENIGIIDFIPRREERLILNTQWKNLECTVACVVYIPKENAVLVFVNVVESYYEKMIKDIKWYNNTNL